MGKGDKKVQLILYYFGLQIVPRNEHRWKKIREKFDLSDHNLIEISLKLNDTNYLRGEK